MKNVATHLAALALGMGAGVGAVAVAADGQQPTAKQSANTGDVIQQLKQANKKLDLVNKNLGGYTTIAPSGGSVQDLLQDIERNTGR